MTGAEFFAGACSTAREVLVDYLPAAYESTTLATGSACAFDADVVTVSVAESEYGNWYIVTTYLCDAKVPIKTGCET